MICGKRGVEATASKRGSVVEVSMSTRIPFGVMPFSLALPRLPIRPLRWS